MHRWFAATLAVGALAGILAVGMRANAQMPQATPSPCATSGTTGGSPAPCPSPT